MPKLAKRQQHRLNLHQFLALSLGLIVIGILTVGLRAATSQADLVLDHSLPHNHDYAPGRLDIAVYPHFRLYSDGLLICQATPGASLMTAKLSSAAATQLYNQVVAGGLLQLNDSYVAPGEHRIAESEESITVNRNGQLKHIGYYSGPRPSAFDAAIMAMKQGCQKATQQFVASEVVVQTVPANGQPQSSWDPTVALPDFTGRSKIYTGAPAQKLAKLFGSKFYRNIRGLNGQTYTAEMFPQLPSYSAATDRKLLLGPKAYAKHPSPEYNVDMVWFYPNDASLPAESANTFHICHDVAIWYMDTMLKQRPVPDDWLNGSYVYGPCNKAIQGQHPSWYYRGCSGPCSGGSTATRDNMIRLIRDELNYLTQGTYILSDKQVTFTTSITVLTDMDDGQHTCGGIAFQDEPFALVLNAASVCLSQDSLAKGKNFSSPAHEQGHTLGLYHTSDNTLMRGGAVLCDWPTCGLGVDSVRGDQANYLRNKSSYFHPATDTYAAPGGGGTLGGNYYDLIKQAGLFWHKI